MTKCLCSLCWFLCSSLLLLLPESATLQWSHSDQLADGKTLTVCQGQNVSLAWRFRPQVDLGEREVSLEWHFSDEDGRPEQRVIAMETRGTFHSYPGLSLTHRLQYTPNAGVHVLNVTDKDTGTYSVHAYVSVNGSVATHVQSVRLVVTEENVTADGRLHAEIAGTVFLNSTGQHHILLSCGNISTVWTPSTDVIWTTPSEEQLTSTFSKDGRYFLAVPNPLLGGDYGCAINTTFPSLSYPSSTSTSPSTTWRCIPDDSPVTWGAVVHVSETEGRLLLMESRVKEVEDKFLDKIRLVEQDNARLEQRVLMAEKDLSDLGDACLKKNESLKTEVEIVERLSRLESNVSSLQLGSSQASVQADTLADQYQNLSHAFQNDRRAVSFYARLMLSLDRNHVASDQPIIFFDVVTNEGGAYDPSTGQFTAPVPGLYSFHLNVMATNGSAHSGSVRADVMVDDVWTALAVTADHRAQHDMGSADVIVRLNRGQRVWAKNKWECVYGPSATTFSGSLLSADL